MKKLLLGSVALVALGAVSSALAVFAVEVVLVAVAAGL